MIRYPRPGPRYSPGSASWLSCVCLSASLLALLAPVGAWAQDADRDERPHRTRVALGPQLVPSYPGSDTISVRPLVSLSRARGDDPFVFAAPDQSFGITLIRSGGFSFGPAAGFEGSRTAEDVGAALPKVDNTLELGGFAQYELGENVRVRGELRHGLGGHNGLVANLGADYVKRDGDRQLISIGPRVTFADDNFQEAYFSVRPEDAVAAGLPAYQADAGVQSVGATVGFIRQFTDRWGIYSYVKYDRLVGDAGDSPIVRTFGSRDQFSGGAALTFTFGRGMN